MTTKEKAFNLLAALDDNASIEQVIYHLKVLRKSEMRLQQLASGQYLEHDELMRQLDAEELI